MFRFWLFGMIISTTTISLNAITGEYESDKKCLPGNSAPENCDWYETWSDDLKKCISENAISKGCKNKCPENCETLIAHTDCSKYCYCNRGNSKVEECPKGFHFSTKKIICLPPAEAKCTQPFTTGATEPGSITPSIKRTDLFLTECEGTCPLINPRTYTVHLPHKKCQKFCKCNWGTPVVMDCPTNLHFNPKLEVCDYPFEANCTGIGSVN